jgi:F420-0:gamma-glutamyl ligase-like protein
VSTLLNERGLRVLACAPAAEATLNIFWFTALPLETSRIIGFTGLFVILVGFYEQDTIWSTDAE